jgi:hypothetical protein
MLKHDAFFFVGLLLFIFLIWVATGGPSRPISWAGPFLNPPAPIGNGQAYFLSGAGFHIGTGSGAGLSIGNSNAHLSIGGASYGAADESFFTNASPYRGEVRFDTNPTDPKESLADEESVTIENDGDGSVTITGWKLVSSASTGTIGEGALVPVTGSVNATAPIELRPGEEAVIGSGRSPIGVSFRENMCTGYLDRYQSFNPPLKRACVSARTTFEDYVGDDGRDSTNDCLSFLNSVGRCEDVTRFPKDSDGDDEVSRSCRDFVQEHLTYNGCVADYRGSRDFAGDQWRVYLGSYAGLWRDTHDAIILLDAQGRTVDVFQY